MKQVNGIARYGSAGRGLSVLRDAAAAVALDAAPELPKAEAVKLAAAARRLYRMRRGRDALFGEYAELLRDPAWDLLLDLFAATLEGRRIAACSAAIASCSPQSTGLRCIDSLVERGLLVRVADPADARRSMLELTQVAMEFMRGAVSGLARELA